MSISVTTNNPYAYLDRALPGDNSPQYVPAAQNEDGESVAENPAFGEDGFGFDDFLDIINPLQHIPVISSLYREITGDEINPGSRMIGGTIFGGGIGLAISFVNSAIEDGTGKDVGEHVLGLFSPADTEITEETLAVAPKADEISAAAEKSSPTNEIAPAPLTSPLPPTAAPINLEWKGARPDLLLNLEKAAQTPELTPEQLNAVMRSFHSAPSTPKAAPTEAASAYQKAAMAAPAALHQAEPTSSYNEERP